MKERVLRGLSLEEAISLFASRKWNFYEVYPSYIKIDAPVGSGESYVVEITYYDQKELAQMKQRLREAGFIEQAVRYVSD